MQKITVLCVGKLKEPFYRDAVTEYSKRLGRYCKLKIVELPEFRLGDSPSLAELDRALAAEGAAIREKLPRGAAIVAMCIEGSQTDSVSFSRRLADFGVAGQSQVVFLIGGSVGLCASLKAEADWRLSLSPMTFPHHLARVMLLEQLYRAYQILEGTHYHK